jgi:hypothetical protein
MSTLNTKVSMAAFGSWRVDPDHRQDRGAGPVISYKMTPEEIEQKYGQIKGQPIGSIISDIDGDKVKQIRAREREEKEMSKDVKLTELDKKINAEAEVKGKEGTSPIIKLSKAEVIRLKNEGKSLEEISEYFTAGWNGKLQLLKAKIILYMSDKKTGGPRKKASNEVQEVNSTEEQHEQFIGNNIDRPLPIETEEYPYLKEVADAIKDSIMEKVKPLPAYDGEAVNHSSHYNAGKIEVIDIIESITNSMNMTPFEGFCIGNAIKYIARWKNKGGFEDLKKAEWYLNRIIKAQKAGITYDMSGMQA